MKKLLVALLLPIISLAQTTQTVQKADSVKETKPVIVTPVAKSSDSAKATKPVIIAPPVAKSFTVKGNLKGLKDSTLVFLQNVEGNMIAQDYAKKGKFSLTGKSDEVSFFQLGFIGTKESTEIFMGNENIVVSGDISNLKGATFSGGAAQADYKSFVKGFLPLNDNLGKIVAGINAEKQGSKKRDTLIAMYNDSRNKLKSFTDKFLKDKAASPVSAFILYQFAKMYDESVLETKYNQLKPSAKKIVFAKEIERMIAAANIGKVGTIATDFSQNDTTGKSVSLNSFRGKYVLVDFWASWCRPCRMENPNVLAAYNKFKDKNFTVLGVSLDKDKASWVKAINDDKLPWTQISDLQQWGNAAAKMYNITTIPSNMLLDPSGKILGKNLRGEELENKLKEVLK